MGYLSAVSFVKFSFTRGLWFDTHRRISLFRLDLVSRILHKCLTEISNIKTDKRQSRNLQELETAVATHILLYEGEHSPENWSYDVILVVERRHTNLSTQFYINLQQQQSCNL